jgi:hypothetical protein
LSVGILGEAVNPIDKGEINVTINMLDDKIEQCPYCGNAFAKHTKLRHVEKCFLKPENGRLLANFFLKGFENINNISWTNTYKFTITNKISTSSTIIIQTDSEGWVTAIIKLLLLFYENGIIDDFEIYDLIIGKLTFWHYYQEQEHERARKQYLSVHRSIDILESIPYENFEKLIMAILARAIFDYQFLKEIGQEAYEDDGIIIDVEETLAIIELCAPKIYKRLTEE